MDSEEVNPEIGGLENKAIMYITINQRTKPGGELISKLPSKNISQSTKIII